jgi:hypothetical protein
MRNFNNRREAGQRRRRHQQASEDHRRYCDDPDCGCRLTDRDIAEYIRDLSAAYLRRVEAGLTPPDPEFDASVRWMLKDAERELRRLESEADGGEE